MHRKGQLKSTAAPSVQFRLKLDATKSVPLEAAQLECIFALLQDKGGSR